MPAPPQASIIIPTYNQRPDVLAAAVLSATRQTVPVEVIVVDDGSDALATVPDGVRLIRHGTNRGISAALNTGIENATAPWICWLSSDDEIAPYKVEVQRMTLDQTGTLASFHSYFRIALDDMDAAGVGVSFYHPPKPQGWPVSVSLTPIWENVWQQRAMMCRDCFVNGSTTMIHRSVFADVGLFDESFRYGQDFEMWARIGLKYRWVCVPCPKCKPTTNVTSGGIVVKETDCPICRGAGPYPLGVRKFGRNLTAAIDADPEKRKRRDEEDRAIRKRYRR